MNVLFSLNDTKTSFSFVSHSSPLLLSCFLSTSAGVRTPLLWVWPSPSAMWVVEPNSPTCLSAALPARNHSQESRLVVGCGIQGIIHPSHDQGLLFYSGIPWAPWVLNPQMFYLAFAGFLVYGIASTRMQTLLCTLAIFAIEFYSSCVPPPLVLLSSSLKDNKPFIGISVWSSDRTS